MPIASFESLKAASLCIFRGTIEGLLIKIVAKGVSGVLRFIDLEVVVVSSMTSDKEIQGGTLTPNPKRGISYPLGSLIFEVIVAAIFHII